MAQSRSTENIPIAYPIHEDHYGVAAEPTGKYTAPNIDELIEKAKEEMEAAAKSLDFLAAAQHRDRMYELIKARDSKVTLY